MCALAAIECNSDIAVRNFSMKRKATMRNRRLTIFPLAIILMTGCGDERAVEPEMIDMTGTWLVQTWSITQVASPQTSVNPFTTAPVGRPDAATDSGLYFYDDGTLLTIINYPDTVKTNTPPPPDEIMLDASAYPVNTWCVSAAANEFFCELALAGEILIDEGDTSEETWTFVRNGDDMTLTAIAGFTYDFGSGAEPATFIQTLDRVLVDYDRPNITDNTR